MEITIRIPDQVYKEDPFYKEHYFKMLQAMTDRMAMSHYKYGPVRANATGGVDEMKSGRQRLWMYDGKGVRAVGKCGNTGNIENLYDAANFFLCEAAYPHHKHGHFRAQSSKESPRLAY